MRTQEHGVVAKDPPSAERYLDTAAVADLLSLSAIYLRQLRVLGGGPRFHRFGAKAVRYRLGDVLEWARSRPAGTSTSEFEAA